MRKGRDKFLIYFILTLFQLNNALGQKTLLDSIQVSGGFVSDSLFVGKDVGFYIKVVYDPALEVILPDSTASLGDFEYSKKKYVKTQLIGGQAVDSVVYFIQSYELDKIQTLALPVYLLDREAKFLIKLVRDSIRLYEVSPRMVTDTTQLLINTDFQEVEIPFNYPLFYYATLGTVLVIVVLLVLFRRRIRRYFVLRRLNKDFRKFMKNFKENFKKIEKNTNAELTEKTLMLWKTYMEKLENVPFTKYSSKEISSLPIGKELRESLRAIDRLIYGGKINDRISQDFLKIENFTKYRFDKKIKKIKKVINKNG